MCIEIDGAYYFIVEFLHVKPEKGLLLSDQAEKCANGQNPRKTFNSG